MDRTGSCYNCGKILSPSNHPKSLFAITLVCKCMKTQRFSQLITKTNLVEHRIIFFLFSMAAGMSLASYLTHSSDMRGGIVTAIFGFYFLFLASKRIRFERVSLPLLILGVFSAVFLVRLFFIFNLDVQPWNDFARTFSAAEKLTNQDYSGVHDHVYSNKYPDLIPWIAFEALIIDLFPAHSLFALRVLNSFVCGIIGVSIFLMGKKISTQIGLLAVGIYALYPESVVYSGVLTCQHFSTACAYLAFVAILYDRSGTKGRFFFYIQPILVGILLGIGQLFRPDALPIILAILFFLLKKNISKGEMGNSWKLELYRYLGIAISFLLVTQAAFLYLEQRNIVLDASRHTDLGYKLYVGFNFHQGRWNSNDEREYFDADMPERRKMVLARMIEYSRRPLRFIEHSFRKYFTMWADRSSAFYWLEGNEIASLEEKISNMVSTGKENNKFNTLMNYQSLFNSLNGGYHFLIMFFASIGVWKFRKPSEENSLLSLLVWVVLFYVAAFVFTEVQNRYRYFLMPIIIIYSSIGVFYLNNTVTSIRNLFHSVSFGNPS